MRYGLIDIGSNTIRGVAYEVEGNKAVKVEDKLVRSHILRETSDGFLTENGINRLVTVLNKLRYVLKKAGCRRIVCFATSAMRDLKNIEQVKEVMLDITNMHLDVLNGVQEAECDFIAMRANIAEQSAIGLDLGGGSCQIVEFEQNRLLFAQSYDIGSNRIRRSLVRRNLPTPEELKKIEFYVRNEVMELTNMFGSRYIYAIGGSARAALRLHCALTNTASTDGFLSVEHMDRICRTVDDNPDKMYDFFNIAVKNRADTVIPGTVTLKTICDILGVDGFYILPCSVRDGYFAKLLRQRQ